MSQKQTVVAAFSILGLLLGGCARVTTTVRQEDGTYHTSKHWVLPSDLPDRSFRCDEDYMVATTLDGVTYAWPRGKGSYSKNFDEISFQGSGVKCNVVGRELSVNESRFGGFQKGDHVRIADNGEVFVNDIKRDPLGGE